MGFGGKKQPAGMNPDRLAALAGGGSLAQADASAAAPRRRVSVEPDMSRIRKCSIDETPEERKKRLAAKTVNFGATFIARIIIMAAAGFFLWTELQNTGKVHRGVVVGMFAMLADFGRVMMKALEPGSK